MEPILVFKVTSKIFPANTLYLSSSIDTLYYLNNEQQNKLEVFHSKVNSQKGTAVTNTNKRILHFLVMSKITSWLW